MAGPLAEPLVAEIVRPTGGIQRIGGSGLVHVARTTLGKLQVQVRSVKIWREQYRKLKTSVGPSSWMEKIRTSRVLPHGKPSLTVVQIIPFRRLPLKQEANSQIRGAVRNIVDHKGS